MPQPCYGIALEHLAFPTRLEISIRPPPIIARYSKNILCKHCIDVDFEDHEFNTIHGEQKRWNDSLPPVIKKITKPEGMKPKACEKVL